MANFTVGTMDDAIKQMEPMKRILLADDVSSEWNQIADVSNYVKLTNVYTDASWAALNEGTDFSDATTTHFVEKEYTIKRLMSEAAWNKSTLENKWLRNAGVPGGELTGFAKYQSLLNDVVIEPLQKEKAKQLFVGDGSTTECSGLTTQLLADGDRVVDTTYSGVTGYDYTAGTIIDAVNSHITFVPEDVLDSDDLVMYMSNANFLMLRAALIDNGNLVQGPGATPGTSVKSFMYPGALQLEIRGVYGLTGTDYMILTPKKNLFYIYNILGFDNEVDFRYDSNYKQYRNTVFASYGATYQEAIYIVTNF